MTQSPSLSFTTKPAGMAIKGISKMKKLVVIIMMALICINILVPKLSLELKDYEVLSAIVKSQSVLLHVLYAHAVPFKVIKDLCDNKTIKKNTDNTKQDSREPVKRNNSSDYSLDISVNNLILNRMPKDQDIGVCRSAFWLISNNNLCTSIAGRKYVPAWQFDFRLLFCLFMFFFLRPRSAIGDSIIINKYIHKNPGFVSKPGFLYFRTGANL